jgi:hypothetical protein
VTDDRNRDRQLEQALTRELRRAEMVEPGGECLDAETLAAWMDGGLGRDAVTLMEAHAAGCPRCRAMIATYTETSPANAAAAESRPRLWRWWLAPIAAATAATVLWIVVPSGDRPTMSSPAPVAEVAPPRREPAAAAPAESDRAAEKVPATPPRARVAEPQVSGNLQIAPQNGGGRGDARQADTANQALEAAQRRADAPRDQREARLERSAADAKQDAAPASPAPPAAEPAARRAFAAEAVIVAAAESSVRWRATSGGIERSLDAGQTWQRVADAGNGVIIAGSAPSPDVCWMVGRGGIVLLTTDARTFTRVPFPEPTDLVLVSANGPRVASVTAADGRVFETSDAGLTWRRR